MPDGEIKTIRKIRHEISEECGHRVDKIVAYYRAVEDELKRSGEFRFAENPTRTESSTDAAGRLAAGAAG
jgi:hypothetical protein